MCPVLGVKVAGDTAWLSLVPEDASAVHPTPYRFDLQRQPRPQALRAAIDDLRLLLRRHDVSAVAMLDAHGNVPAGSYKRARKRFTLELMVELAADHANVEYKLMPPARIQSVLDLPTRRLPDHVDAFATRSGTHWNHRGPAALAAIAVLREGDA